MKARIRYTKIPDSNWLLSTSSFAARNGSVKAMLNDKELKYRIVKHDTHDTIYEGEGVNSHELKKHIKAKLNALGVEFAPEKRMRGSQDLLDALAGYDD